MELNLSIIGTIKLALSVLVGSSLWQGGCFVQNVTQARMQCLGREQACNFC